MPEKSYEKTPLYEANKMMRQPTGQTFHDWARIRPASFQDYFLGGTDANISALTNTVTLESFEDALSSYFAIKIKARDPDKLFPREARIELLKAELKNKGSTSKPEGYDQSANNAGYKYWAHNTFEFRPSTVFQFKSRLIQHPGLLYFKETEKSQKEIVRKWKKLDPDSEGPFFQAPITSVENSYVDFLKAHIYRAQGKNGNLYFVHRGRDETYARLTMGISSSFAKQLVTDISWKCPTCEPRMRELSETGKAREKERSKKRKAEHTEEENLAKKKQKKQKKRLVESSQQAQTTQIQQPLQSNDFGNSYSPQSALEYLQNDFGNIFLLQSVPEYQLPEDNDVGYSNLLASSEPIPLSQDSQNNGPGDVHWIHYEGYGYYYLHCPPDHRLRWYTITMTYWGTVEIQRLGEPAKHTPDYSFLPAELLTIPLPPGIHFYNNPDHPVFIDLNTKTVCMNSGQPIELAATTPPMQTMAGLGDLPIDPATNYATETFENPPIDPSNNNISEDPAYDNSIHNIDPQLSSSSEISDPSLANPNALLFEPFDKGLIDPEDEFLLGLNNFIIGSSYVPDSDFVQENNVDFFDQQLPSNSATLDTNSNISNANLDFKTPLEKPASLAIREQEDEETADAKPSP